MPNITLEEAEHTVLEQVKFLNFVLEECRRRNKALEALLGMSYGKFVGIGTVYEEAVCSLRKVKAELDEYLGCVRGELREAYRARRREERRGPRRDGGGQPPPLA